MHTISHRSEFFNSFSFRLGDFAIMVDIVIISAPRNEKPILHIITYIDFFFCNIVIIIIATTYKND